MNMFREIYGDVFNHTLTTSCKNCLRIDVLLLLLLLFFPPDPSHVLLESLEPQQWDELRRDGLDFGTLTFATGGVLVPLSSVTLAPLPPSGSFVCESPGLHSGLEVLLFAPDKRNHFSAVISSGHLLLLLHFKLHTQHLTAHAVERLNPGADVIIYSVTQPGN